MMLLFGLLSLFLCLFLKVAYTSISFMEKQGVHGPKPHFLLGNIVEVGSLVSMTTSNDMDSIHHDIVSRLLPHYLLWSKQYGKRFIYWVGNEPRICLTDPKMIKELLSSKYSNLCGKSWLQQQNSKHFIGRGLLMANGQDWHHQRHIVASAFMADKLKLREEKRIFDLLTSLQNLCAQSSRRLCLPGSRFFPSKYNRDIKALKMEVERLLMEIIQSRKDCAEIGRSTSYGNDLLGMLLSETQKKRANGFGFNLQLLMDECKTFFFTGHETTALLLTWTVMLLATNPDWQEKVRAELLQVCNGETPSPEQLSKLTTLNMVINESLRLYPPASLLPRMVFEDIKLGDLEIPKGLSIWIPVLAIHHNKELWGEDSYAPGLNFMPFAARPRNCVGQAFALMESKIILAMMISQFRFTISENYRHAPIIVLTLKPKHGVQICLEPLSL
ncbi:hypothetical protein ACHQM5_003171 [Ranunculus cassubicifolius]